MRGATRQTPRPPSTKPNFNPRTPCGVRRSRISRKCGKSTDFNPRTPCGVRRCCGDTFLLSKDISIHAPRAGCDHHDCGGFVTTGLFQSTHPVRGATTQSLVHVGNMQISIHAPRAGCDQRRARARTTCPCYFNPRTPCGVRLTRSRTTTQKGAKFQSTHPVRGATLPIRGSEKARHISIHAPRAGCDNFYFGGCDEVCIFQSTHPVRGATIRM